VTSVAAPQAHATHPSRSRFVRRVKSKDPELSVVKRSARAAVALPAVFGLSHVLFSNPQVSLLGAFGSVTLLLLVDFPGPLRVRLVSYGTLFVIGVCFIAGGTVISTHKVAAILAMAVVGFAVLFVGIVSPRAAAASTATLLLFVLPVAVAEPAAMVGPRLIGWALAGGFCIPACMFVWPTPWHDNLRRRLSASMSAIGGLAVAQMDGRSDPAAQAAVTSELALLRGQLAGTPYPPTGATASAVTLVNLVGRVEWVAGNAALVNEHDSTRGRVQIQAVIEAVAETLRGAASLVCDDHAHPVDDPDRVHALQESTIRLDQLISTELDYDVSRLIGPGMDPVDVAAPPKSATANLPKGEGIASALDPSFHARALSIATEMVADATLESVGAQPVSARRFGVVGDSSSSQIWRRLASHLSFRSVWFRNAVRGAMGLAVAMAVVEITDVEHGFWVVLGTLSVLRSNALGTGATALRAVAGTAVGVVVGAAIMVGVADRTTLLWAILPLAVLVSGVAPSLISFAAGQAGFTLVVIIVFNIIAPTGWRVGLTRIEDVAIGCGVSIVVGLLFWPRGATAALGRALSDAFVASSGFLADAVDRLTTTSHPVDTMSAERASHNAYLRLDDAFRQFLAERGAKVVPAQVVTNLFTGSNRIRLAAYTLVVLPVFTVERGPPDSESMAIAGAVLRDSYSSNRRWYEEFAEMLAGRRDGLEPPPLHNEALHDVLRTAFEDARAGGESNRLRTILQMLWADELLETQRQIQADLAESAQLFNRHRQRIFI